MALNKEELEVILSLLEDELERCYRYNAKRTKSVTGARIELQHQHDILTNKYESNPLYIKE